MEEKLKELLISINSRFSGPESSNMHDMINGKLDFDDDKIKSYLIRLKDYGGTHGNYNKQSDRRDAQSYLNLFTEYLNDRKKNRI